MTIALTREEVVREQQLGRSLLDIIRVNLREIPISMAQLDPNGICNAGCWFCPIKYEGNPEEFKNQLTPEELEKILKKIRESPAVSPKLDFIYTAHYNEILLYKYFEEMLELFRKYGIKTMVLSNGTTLTPAKTDVIMRYLDVVLGVHLNIPSFERDDWAKKAGFDPKLFDNLQRNLDYYHATSPLKMSVQINCSPYGGVALSEGMADDREHNQAIKASFEQRYPGVSVSIIESLIDRAGSLSKINVIRGVGETTKPVVGCSHTLDASRGRIFGWLHVNAKGDLFLCCNDFKMNYRFGNLLEDRTLEQLWLSDRHVDMILNAFKKICKGCSSRITL